MADLAAASRTRLTLRRATEDGSTFGEEIRAGLTAVRKSIPPRYFYDDLGSALFDAITHLPEYYVTRAETEVLTGYRREIAASMGAVTRLVELGSGSARKSRLLIDELTRAGHEIEYVPVDVDVSTLQRVGRELLHEQPSLTIAAVAGDFRRVAGHLRDLPAPAGRTCVLFLGSTVGNLDATEAVAMLRDIRGALRAGDTMLLGADLKKAKPLLDAAYNDVLGVTAAFNLNLLQRINRELGGHFNLRSFAHHAFYDEPLGRIEMHLVSLRDQSVLVEALGIEVAFVEGETIHTENSYKYDEATLAQFAAASGFDLAHRWTDSQGWFAEVLLVAR